MNISCVTRVAWKWVRSDTWNPFDFHQWPMKLQWNPLTQLRWQVKQKTNGSRYRSQLSTDYPIIIIIMVMVPKQQQQKKNLWEKTGEKSLRGRLKVTKKMELADGWHRKPIYGHDDLCEKAKAQCVRAVCNIVNTSPDSAFLKKKWFFFSPRPKRVNHFSVLIPILVDYSLWAKCTCAEGSRMTVIGSRWSLPRVV